MVKVQSILILFLLFHTAWWGGVWSNPAAQTKYKFGDIIRFPEHYGIGRGLRDKEGNELIFHNTFNGCKTSIMRPDQISTLDNYQDHSITVNVDEMKKRLKECEDNKKPQMCCGELNRLTNNCEHTATYIRYGEKGRVSCLLRKGYVKVSPPAQCKHWVDKYPDAKVTSSDVTNELSRSCV